MKLTKSQEKKLRKKLKLKSSSEDVFVKMYLEDIKKEIGKRIQQAQTISDVDDIIDNINFKELSKQVKALRNKVLIRNNQGFEEIIKSITSGLNEISKKKKENKLFNKEMTKLIKNQKLTDPLMDIFENNMLKIKDLPKDVYKLLRKGYTQGKSFRGTELEQDLYEKLGSRAKLIVRTESAKVNEAITEVRSRSVGVKGYIWSTSGDARVRDTHAYLDGVFIFWNDAPTFIHISKKGKRTEDRHHSGNIYNCRCIALPVFDIDDLHFPIKVAEHAVLTDKYINSHKSELSVKGIVSYTKTQFLQKYGKLFITNESELKRLIENK